MEREINDLLDRKKMCADEDVGVKRLWMGVVMGDKFMELGREDKRG